MRAIEMITKKCNQVLSKPGLNQLISRVAVGVVMWPHGAQLLLGSFGGSGFTETMKYFTTQAGLPWVLGLMVILIQFFGSLFILLGFFTRINALLMSVIVFNMIFFGHIQHGFFMNWFGNQAGEGFEFHILLLGLTLSLIFSASSRYSIDSIIEDRFNK